MYYWGKVSEIESHKYTCGFCGSLVASDRGYVCKDEYDQGAGWIRLCPHCERPTYFDDQVDRQYPGVTPGNDVDSLPNEVEALYREARRCVSVGASTAAVLTCRKLLMHVAVANGAPNGRPFIEYVEYLADEGFVPPNGKGWVDHIRKKGNEANHEIVLMDDADAVELLAFAEMLLKFIYEFPSRVLGDESSG